MDDEIKKLFYIEKSLNNYKYVFHLPKYSDAQRIELSSRIQAVGGRVTFSYNSENIIVIDNTNELRSANIKPHISNANLILVMESRKIKFYHDQMLGETSNKFDFKHYEEMGYDDYERFFPACAGESKEANKNSSKKRSANYPNGVDNKNNNHHVDDFDFYLKEIPERENLKIYKLICYRELIGILDEIEPFTIELQYRYGLSKNVDTSALISLVNFNELDAKKLSFHSFAKIKSEKTKKNKDNSINNSDGKSSRKEEVGVLEAYDLPFFDLKIDAGFSIFMTKEEKKTIDHYVSRKKNHKGSKEKANNEKNNRFPLKSPEPRKDHNTCYVCNLKYDVYSEHIKSQLHFQSLHRNRDNFKKLNETFDRINNFWKDKEINKTDLNLHKLKLGEDSSSIGMHLEFNNMTTADTISNLNCALTNKINNKNNQENKLLQIQKDENNNTLFKKIISNNFYSQAEYNYQNENNNNNNNNNNPNNSNKLPNSTSHNNNINFDKDNYFIDEMNHEENNHIQIEIQKNSNTDLFLNPLTKNNCASSSANLLYNNNNTSGNNTSLNFSGVINLSNNPTQNNNNNNNSIVNQQTGERGKEDFNEEYKRILRNKGNKTNKYFKDRPGMDYSLEKQIIPREENQLYLNKRNKVTQQNSLNSNLHSINESSLKTYDNSERANNTGLLKSLNTNATYNNNNFNSNLNSNLNLNNNNIRFNINNNNKNFTKNNNNNSINESLLDRKSVVSSDGESLISNFSDNLGLESAKINANMNFLNNKLNNRRNNNGSNNGSFATRQELLLKRNNLSLHSNNTSISNTSGILNRDLNSKFSCNNINIPNNNNQKKMQSNLSLGYVNSNILNKSFINNNNNNSSNTIGLFNKANADKSNNKESIQSAGNQSNNLNSQKTTNNSITVYNKRLDTNLSNLNKHDKKATEKDKSRLIKNKYLLNEEKIIAEEPTSKYSLYLLKSNEEIIFDNEEKEAPEEALNDKNQSKGDDNKNQSLMDIEDDYEFYPKKTTKNKNSKIKNSKNSKHEISISNNNSVSIEAGLKLTNKSDILFTNPEVTFSREFSPKGFQSNDKHAALYDLISMQSNSLKNNKSENNLLDVIVPDDVAVIIENELSKEENDEMNKKLEELKNYSNDFNIDYQNNCINDNEEKNEAEKVKITTENENPIEKLSSMCELPVAFDIKREEEDEMLIEITNNEKTSLANTSENYLLCKLNNPVANLNKTSNLINIKNSPVSKGLFLNRSNIANSTNREKALRNSAGRNVNCNNDEANQISNKSINTGTLINLKSYSAINENLNNSYNNNYNRENSDKNNLNILKSNRKLDFENFNKNSSSIFNNKSNNNNTNIFFINTKEYVNNNDNQQQQSLSNFKPNITTTNHNLFQAKIIADSQKQVNESFPNKIIQDSSNSSLASQTDNAMLKNSPQSSAQQDNSDFANKSNNNSANNIAIKTFNFNNNQRQIIIERESNNNNNFNYPNSRNTSKKDLSVVNFDKSNSDLKRSEKSSSELLKKSSREIIFTNVNDNNNFNNIRTIYSPCEIKNYNPPYKSKAKIIYNKTNAIGNASLNELRDNNNNDFNNNNYDFIDKLSLSRNLGKDETRNFGKKYKFEEWSKFNTNNLNGKNSYKNHYNNNININNNNNNIDNFVEESYKGNSKKRIFRDFNGNNNKFISVNSRTTRNINDIANSKNKEKINKIKNKKNRKVDKIQNEFNATKNYINNEKRYKLN